MNREAAVARARELVGCPWRHRGRTERGIDCIGLIIEAVRAGGGEIRDRRDYGREPWNDGLQTELRRQFGDPIPKDCPEAWQPGDIVVFGGLDTRDPFHVGVLATSPRGWSLIHSHSRYHVAEHDLVGKWHRMLVEVYQWDR